MNHANGHLEVIERTFPARKLRRRLLPTPGTPITTATSHTVAGNADAGIFLALNGWCRNLRVG
jgi:hypothetical protein